eukprot:NODE_5809_length_965_cov_4.127078_g5226_i0.p1 GENE.NODE_5809_length_965_cov_4.127078_g5226_i0~~NODE_5809_length_965_cov_4.127078_g5226_i0.p1  ORF type:complete len:305 (+),score=42.68 NODE_5809_length_965_cov_4.127078_g5226_i0:123-917(+)
MDPQYQPMAFMSDPENIKKLIIITKRIECLEFNFTIDQPELFVKSPADSKIKAKLFLQREQHHSATIIQKAFKCYLARKKLSQLKSENVIRNSCALVIQTAVRGWLVRKGVNIKLEEARRYRATSEQKIHMKGWLHMKTPKMHLSKKRYCIVRGAMMLVYKEEECIHKVVDLTLVDIATSATKHHGFSVLTNSGLVQFWAKNEQLQKEWLNSFEKAVNDRHPVYADFTLQLNCTLTRAIGEALSTESPRWSPTHEPSNPSFISI